MQYSSLNQGSWGEIHAVSYAQSFTEFGYLKCVSRVQPLTPQRTRRRDLEREDLSSFLNTAQYSKRASGFIGVLYRAIHSYPFLQQAFFLARMILTIVFYLYRLPVIKKHSILEHVSVCTSHGSILCKRAVFTACQ